MWRAWATWIHPHPILIAVVIKQLHQRIVAIHIILCMSFYVLHQINHYPSFHWTVWSARWERTLNHLVFLCQEMLLSSLVLQLNRKGVKPTRHNVFSNEDKKRSEEVASGRCHKDCCQILLVSRQCIHLLLHDGTSKWTKERAFL